MHPHDLFRFNFLSAFKLQTNIANGAMLETLMSSTMLATENLYGEKTNGNLGYGYRD